MKIVKTVVKTLVISLFGFLIGVIYDDKDNRTISLEEKHILRELASVGYIKRVFLRCNVPLIGIPYYFFPW